MRESALQALESCVLRCPREVSPHVEAVLALALDYLKYDPNFADDSDGDDEEMDDQEEDEEAEEDNSDGEYSDDEDSSWKTRRAAARWHSSLMFIQGYIQGYLGSL
jgi:cullin-associated NEDD8-dissociated protein 1